jgi:hypothetical protein
MLMLYVICTVWYEFANIYLMEGLGITPGSSFGKMFRAWSGFTLKMS